MAASIQVKRGITAKVAAYTPLSGELVLDTTTNKLYAGDGSTAGGKQIVASQKGVTDASNAATGDIGELLSNSATGTSMTTSVTTNLVSLTLTAGDWDVEGVYSIRPAGGAALSQVITGLVTTSAASAVFPNRAVLSSSITAVSEGPTPNVRFSISANTTIYLTAATSFTSGTVTGDGYLKARRVR